MKQRKSHGRPLTSMDHLKTCITETEKKKLKSYLRLEVGFQKALHPFDAKERSYLYEMNFATLDELSENLILLDNSQNKDAPEYANLPSEIS